MAIVYAAPAFEPETTVEPWGPRKMTWTGFDGSVWPLTRPDAVNPRMRPGVKGLHMPRFDVHTSSTPLVPGEETLGYSIPARSVFWPLLFRASSVAEWEQQHAGFFDSIHPTETGTWTVGEGDNARSLELRDAGVGEHAFSRDPFVHGLAVIGLELVAPRPLWRGAEIRRTFKAEPEPDFIPSDPEDPNYHPTSILGYGSARIENPGNEPSYAAWEVEGPHPPGLVLGVGTFLVQVPFAIPEGSTFILDTDPTAPYARLDGVDMTTQLGFQVFAPVPARGDAPLIITTGGTGNVTVKLQPLYWRAF